MITSFRRAVPDQQVARSQFATLYPELQYLIIDEHVYIVSVVVELAQIIFLFSCFFRLGIGLLTVIFLIWMSHGALHRFDLSIKTRRIHLQLIRSLCYQISIPIVAFYVPLLVVVTPLMITIDNSQMSFFISLLFMSFHTAMGTISMIYFNRHYRYWLISTIRRLYHRKSISIPTDFITRDRNFNVSKNASAMF
uniref:G protein-coupled receptor n=1 Tax=Caenorhabditis tropicalis TaxID=1561998 RepID=A0A1I7U9K9_9PELO